MTLTVEQGDLVNAVRRVHLKGLRGVCPVLLCPGRDEALELRTDSVDVRVEATVPVLDGRLIPALVPFDNLLNVVKNYPKGPVRLSVEDRTLTLKGGRRTTKMATLDPSVFPRRPGFTADAVVSLKGAWERVAWAASAADTDAVDWIRHLLLWGDWAYATNRYRVHRAALPEPFPNPVLLPGQVVELVLKAKTDITELHLGPRDFTLRGEGVSWTGQLRDTDKVVETARRIDKPFSQTATVGVTFTRKELTGALADLLSGMSLDDAVPVRIEAAEDTAVISRVGQGIGEDQVELDCGAGGLIDVRFNARWLLNTLRLVDSEIVELCCGENPRWAWWLRLDGFEAAIMPVVV